MTPTIISCGQLRLAVPQGTQLPSVTLCQSGQVDVSFANFTGTVRFEALPNANSTAGALLNPTSTQLTTPVSNALLMPPLMPTSHIDSAAMRQALSQPFTQPLSRPIPECQRIQPSVSQQIPISMSQPNIAPSSQAIAPTVSQPLSQPFSQDLLHSSQSFSPPFMPETSSQKFTNDLYGSPPVYRPSQTFPAAQVCASIPESVPSQEKSPPKIPHFDPEYMDLTPPSPPSSLDSSEEEPPKAKPAKKKKKKSSANKSKKRESDKMESVQKETFPAKRPAVSCVEYRPAKNGKRVRFEDEPVFLGSPMKTHFPSTKVNVEEKKSTSLSPVKKSSPWTTVILDEKSKLPDRRWGASFTRVSEESIILLGGESEAAGFFKNMAIFDIGKRMWVQDGKDTPDMHTSGRAWHTATCVDSNVFVFGGEMEVDGERTQTNDALIYDTTYYTWYPPGLSGNTPAPRAGHCAALIPKTKNIAVYGGINGNKWLCDLYILEDMNAWTKVRLSTKSVKPSARSYASLTSANDFLVLFGGNNKSKCFNDVHFLLPDKNWVQPVVLGRSPKARTGHCAIASRDGKKVIIYGGWDDQGAQRLFYSDVWELHIKSQTECFWKCLHNGDNSSRIPGPRAGASMCGTVGEKDEMLLFGGWYQINYYNDVCKLVTGPGMK